MCFVDVGLGGPLVPATKPGLGGRVDWGRGPGATCGGHDAVPARATKALSLPLLPACRKVPEFCGLHFPQKTDRGDSAIATL